MNSEKQAQVIHVLSTLTVRQTDKVLSTEAKLEKTEKFLAVAMQALRNIKPTVSTWSHRQEYGDFANQVLAAYDQLKAGANG